MPRQNAGRFFARRLRRVGVRAGYFSASDQMRLTTARVRMATSIVTAASRKIDATSTSSSVDGGSKWNERAMTGTTFGSK